MNYSKHNLLSVTAHPDDMEMHHSGILAHGGIALVASDGEASTLNYTSSHLCRQS